uniref:Uncharacterized protein n=1 Tax=Salix viminalis TaxID=40686 RepID=A0A6N2LCJ9_SALVM
MPMKKPSYGNVLQWIKPDAWVDKRKDLIPKTINRRLQTKKRQQMNKNGKKKRKQLKTNVHCQEITSNSCISCTCGLWQMNGHNLRVNLKSNLHRHESRSGHQPHLFFRTLFKIASPIPESGSGAGAGVGARKTGAGAISSTVGCFSRFLSILLAFSNPSLFSTATFQAKARKLLSVLQFRK